MISVYIHTCSERTPSITFEVTHTSKTFLKTSSLHEGADAVSDGNCSYGHSWKPHLCIYHFKSMSPQKRHFRLAENSGSQHNQGAHAQRAMNGWWCRINATVPHANIFPWRQKTDKNKCPLQQTESWFFLWYAKDHPEENLYPHRHWSVPMLSAHGSPWIKLLKL